MKLNHVNLPVADVGATRDFFARYFGLKTVMELPRNTMAMLQDEGGMVLILSHFDKADGEVEHHRDFHVGFFLDTREEVDAVHAEMIAGGIEAEAPKKMPGRYAFYVKAPGGFVTEVASFEGAAWAS